LTISHTSLIRFKKPFCQAKRRRKQISYFSLLLNEKIIKTLEKERTNAMEMAAKASKEREKKEKAS